MARKKRQKAARTNDFKPPEPSLPWDGTPTSPDISVYLEGDVKWRICGVCARKLRKKGRMLEIKGPAATRTCEFCTKDADSPPAEPQTMEDILAKAQPLVHNIGVGNVEQLSLF